MDSSIIENGALSNCICEHEYRFLSQEETKQLLPYLERELNDLRVQAAVSSPDTRNMTLQACPYLELEQIPGKDYQSSQVSLINILTFR